MIRPMTPDDEPAVRALVAALHPTWPSRPTAWYTLEHSTLVLEIGGEIAGYTVWGYTSGHAYGRDHGVRPDLRGRGLGHALHQARLDACRTHGAALWVGICWEGNTAMVRVLEAAGAVKMSTHPGYFADNDPPTDGATFVQRLNEG